MTIRDRAIRFAADLATRVDDWQEIQDALANHPEFGPWLDQFESDGDLAEVQSIIRAAEARAGSALNY